MHETVATLIVAGYPDIAAAQADFRALHDVDADSEAALVHATVSRLNRHGRSGPDGEVDEAAQQAATTSAVEGLLSRWVGFDNRHGNVADGLGRDDLRELGALIDRSPFVIVAVISGHGAGQFVDRLTSDDLLVKQRTSDDVRFANLLQRYRGIAPN